MYTEKDEEIIIKYLQKHYSVSRVKVNNKFKRAIVLNNGEIYELNDKTKYPSLKSKLTKTLNLIFNFDETFCLNILNKFLPL